MFMRNEGWTDPIQATVAQIAREVYVGSDCKVSKSTHVCITFVANSAANVSPTKYLIVYI